MNIFSQSKPEPSTAEPRTITNATKTGDNFASSWVPVRPGADDHERLPSRINNRLEYRDGRVEELS